MVNLLPESEKKELISIKQQKVVVIIGLLFAYFTISISLILWAIDLNIVTEKNYKEVAATMEEQRLDSKESNAISGVITEINSDLLKIKTTMDNKEEITGFIKKISSDIPGDIYLTALSYQGGLFTVSGFATKREDLLVFKENLEKEAIFKDINFPPVNWVKPKAIMFTISFSVSK